MFNDPTFWVAVAFFLLIGLLLWLKVPKKMGHHLDERAVQIEAEIRKAEQLFEEAQDMCAKWERKCLDAEAQTKKIIATAQEEADRLRTIENERLAQSLARREKLALDRIAQMEARAVQEVRNFTIEIAGRASAELIAASAATHTDKYVNQAIKDLDKHLH